MTRPATPLPIPKPAGPQARRSAMLAAAALCLLATGAACGPPASGLRFDPEANAYTGLTFTFDPRLDKRVEWLHFEHWLSVMQHSSSLLYEALNGRAHLAEVRVLIPYKWRQPSWPLLHKPGVPVMMNRRLRYADSDVIVGFEDPVHKETPVAVQHDECARPGLGIHMPISFLDQNQPLADPRLKARLLVREFAAHRYGIFKESGFRHDFMYPPFSALAGLAPAGRRANRTLATMADQLRPAPANLTSEGGVAGFDEHWNECSFDASPASGLPTPAAAGCAPYLTKPAPGSASFNLMSSDPFSYSELPGGPARALSGMAAPAEWRELADSLRWHFCGDNFPPPEAGEPGATASGSGAPAAQRQPTNHQSFVHNQLASNKQNVMCNERSAMDVIRSHEDFKRTSPFSAGTFNRLPATNFRFLQEMPPRMILCVEYAAHLYQSRRLDHGILEAAIAKFLAYDLIADTELALVLFGQQQSQRSAFKRLDANVESRLTLYSPPIDPFDEPARLYTEQELGQLDVGREAKLVKGSCSFAKVMAEAALLLQQRAHYDDTGADIVIVTSGLFVEDQDQIRDALRALKLDQVQLNLIIYPSTLLFDTKSRDGYVVLSAAESEAVVAARVAKLLLIQRLANAKIHLVKEHLDANGDVKMSTLVQFYQVFEHIARGHSWDQTQAMQLVERAPVEARGSPAGAKELKFQFQLDGSIQHELIAAFVDPRPSQQHRSGKRFAIRNLQLRSPGGHLLLTDSHPFALGSGANSHEAAGEGEGAGGGAAGEEPAEGRLTSVESTLFAHRTQLGLAGFHLKASHLAALVNGSQHNRIAGFWTLTATADEPLQTSALAMARVNPAGDSVTADCWVQTYHEPSQPGDAADQPRSVRAVKVFARVRAGAQAGVPRELAARLEVQDELGSIVQNVNMLDDGLGVPDMTAGDGIFSQLVQRADRPGYYKVSVELSHRRDGQPSGVARAAGAGQDNACCGSFVPQPAPGSQQQPDTRYLSRQLYCGTFHLDASNKLGQQRPPRVTNLTVVNVDQDNRRVTVRWFEPQVDLFASSPVGAPAKSGAHLLADSNELSESPQTKRAAPRQLFARADDESERQSDALYEAASSIQQQQAAKLRASSAPRAFVLGAEAPGAEQLGGRYELKLFSDRDQAKRSFDANVGFRFDQWTVEGSFPNASSYGGQRELTLRMPTGREGIYYIAMKVYNNLGTASHLSNIAQFWMRNNLTQDEAESLYGQATTVDAEGNVYDKNGELIQRGSGGNPLTYSLLKGPNFSLDGISVLVFISLLAFLLFFSLVCISLVACLASSTRRALKGKRRPKADDKKAAIATGASSGSVVSSACGSSQQSELASSASGSQGGHDVEINKLSLVGCDELNYSNLQQAQAQHQQRAHLIQSAHMISPPPLHQDPQSGYLSYQPEALYQQQQQYQEKAANQWLQHTMVNGYAYATVNPAQHQQGAQSPDMGDLNQNGLGGMSPVASWPADILLSHYDKVKQARERNEAPPVMRVETLEQQGPFGEAAGLPLVEDAPAQDQSYLVRNQMPSYFNQQLQQQLSSVLRNKQRQQRQKPDRSSPALEGLTDQLPDLEASSAAYAQQLASAAEQLPPPHYVYCSSADSQQAAQQQQLINSEQSIYSQVANLQQVPSGGDALAGYYANQWQPPLGQANQTGSSIYSAVGVPGEYAPADKSNSAISEV